jgi:hypothetical protein
MQICVYTHTCVDDRYCTQHAVWGRAPRYQHAKRPLRPDGQRGRMSLQRINGGGGTRTPKGLRPPHFECGALPIRLRLLVLHKVGTAGFEPATPRSRSECSTGLSHVPKTSSATPTILTTEPNSPATTLPTNHIERTGWDSNPRGLLTPHDFQSCSLSRSDTGPWRSGEGGIRTRVCLLGTTV